ncbi:NADH-dependent flavin oxidoreductase [Ruoffia tabacinasalis]|uniref:NADH-dependent flavin oxidoreductase n=1 Tax=Ruoffia tabacinasalis TaxID=87458 RepID=A0ABS0LIY3_9LACT|nr:NADH-dependent flavin oxidoreductase [Ruoffia tabacinasalis]MBG9978109.1 NADH-dependent flavin oxidoreductase [Ruoffia tabacinasalis]
MNQQFERLFQAVNLPNGSQLSSRFAMAPMVAVGSTYEGFVGEDDLKYFERRSQTGSLLLTGAANVGPYGNAFGYGLGIQSDEHIPGMKKLANAMKAKGAKAMLQIFHPGRQAKYTYQDEGKVYGPSTKDFAFLDYPVTGMTNEEVYEFVQYFADATKRAIEAGFDGVEIHGANHYLIQQFFSELSNERDDEWGGSREKRAAFPLAVVKAVQEVVSEYANDGFIIGYRISPEEIHGEVVGYNFDDALYLIDQVAELGVDYIHVSQFGPNGFKNKARLGEHKGEVINEVVHELLADRTLLIGAGDLTSPDKLLEALNYVDILAMGSAAIVEPDLMQKLKAGADDSISLDAEDVSDLALPERFYLMAGALRGNGSVPKETIEQIEK